MDSWIGGAATAAARVTRTDTLPFMDRASSVTVVPATLESWDAVEKILGGDGERGCWCQAWRGRDATAKRNDETRPATLRRQLAGAVPPPGFLAFLDGEPIGWVGVSLRTATPRLLASRTIPRIDELPVWAIGCLRVRPGFRRRGVTTALIAGVVEAARAAGAPGVEAWPIDPAGGRVDAGGAYVGIATTFARSGFHRVLETGARSAGLPRILMRLNIDRAPAASSKGSGSGD